MLKTFDTFVYLHFVTFYLIAWIDKQIKCQFDLPGLILLEAIVLTITFYRPKDTYVKHYELNYTVKDTFCLPPSPSQLKYFFQIKLTLLNNELL